MSQKPEDIAEEILRILRRNGVDTETAVNNFLGDRYLYLNTLSLFISDAYFSRLKAFVKVGTRKSSLKIARFLNSLSERLCLSSFYRYTRPLVSAIDKDKDNQRSEFLTAKLIEENERLNNLLGDILSELRTPPPQILEIPKRPYVRKAKKEAEKNNG